MQRITRFYEDIHESETKENDLMRQKNQPFHIPDNNILLIVQSDGSIFV